MCYKVYSMTRRTALLALVLCGCLSPSLPLPPPTEPSQSQSTLGADYVHLKGVGAETSAAVIIQNLGAPSDKAISGAIPDAQGNWEKDIYAHKGDVVHIWQDYQGQESHFLEFTIR